MIGERLGRFGGGVERKTVRLCRITNNGRGMFNRKDKNTGKGYWKDDGGELGLILGNTGVRV